MVDDRAEPLFSEFLPLGGHQPLPETVGVFLRRPESLIKVLRTALGFTFFIVAADAVDEDPSFAFQATKAFGNLIQSAIKPLDEGVLDYSLFNVKGMDYSQHCSPAPL